MRVIILVLCLLVLSGLADGTGYFQSVRGGNTTEFVIGPFAGSIGSGSEPSPDVIGYGPHEKTYRINDTEINGLEYLVYYGDVVLNLVIFEGGMYMDEFNLSNPEYQIEPLAWPFESTPTYSTKQIDGKNVVVVEGFYDDLDDYTNRNMEVRAMFGSGFMVAPGVMCLLRSDVNTRSTGIAATTSEKVNSTRSNFYTVLDSIHIEFMPSSSTPSDTLSPASFRSRADSGA